jgi:ferredoxin-NADP reductase
MAMFRAIRKDMQLLTGTYIDLFFSCRGDEINLIREMTSYAPNINILVFDSTASSATSASLHTDVKIFSRRMTIDDLLLHSNSDNFNGYSNTNNITINGNNSGIQQDTQVYLCGPSEYMSRVRDWLRSPALGLPQDQVHYESFAF